MNDLPEIRDDEYEAEDLDRAIARWINKAKTADVFSFSYARRLWYDYKKWRPVSLEEYRLKLKGDQAAIRKFREEMKRRIHNERVAARAQQRNIFQDLI